MNTRWRLWLLPLLTLCFFISAFEVNTDEIANTWGDCYDAYLPVEYAADSIQSATVSPWRLTGSVSQTLQPAALFLTPITGFCRGNYRLISRPFRRIYLQCCQWLI
ncbi:hypothetical protein [Spirosoma pollinicola]|uniref:hypothetical protein n=1 Tax=Spirosoma pollinicola TaxID=2057025 RepID=UPI0012FDC922|nr:hypothetical protein [Spirosoma pollinicola]